MGFGHAVRCVVVRATATLVVALTCPARALADGGEVASLRDCSIVLAEGQPAFVERAVEDLRQVVRSATGSLPPVETLRAGSHPGSAGPLIEIGMAAAAEIDAGKHLPVPTPPESFTVAARWAGQGERRSLAVAVCGADAAGLKFGVVDLIRLLRIGGGDAKIGVPLHVAKWPRFATRSMYAHLHWSYNHPYALRSWRLEDWKRYVDLLTHLGFNTIQIWPMMELLPHPLSADDEAYLKRYAELVDYAHEQRGMKVFIGSCPNNITEDAKGVPIARREYFDFEKRLDPGKPENLVRILEYRGDLYETVSDADGYWVIDSDPGGWKGSPSSDFVNILIGHRKLIDRYGKRPTEQPLIYWMWYGWGTASREQNWRTTLTDMKARMKGPWRVHACNPQHVDACRELGLLDRTIYFPYNLLETEPSGPLTELRFAGIGDAARIATQAGIAAIQGNTQTPLMQLPNIAELARAAWAGDAGSAAGGSAGDSEPIRLADRIVSKDAESLAAAWLSLAKEDARESMRLAERLRLLASDNFAGGTLAVVLGDWQPRVLEDLATMLRIHACAVTFSHAVVEGADVATLTSNLAAYLREAADWLERTGYHGRHPFAHDAYRGLVVTAVSSLRTKLGEQSLMEKVVGPALAAAAVRHDPKTIGMLREMLSGKPN